MSGLYVMVDDFSVHARVCASNTQAVSLEVVNRGRVTYEVWPRSLFDKHYVEIDVALEVPAHVEKDG